MLPPRSIRRLVASRRSVASRREADDCSEGFIRLTAGCYGLTAGGYGNGYDLMATCPFLHPTSLFPRSGSATAAATAPEENSSSFRPYRPRPRPHFGLGLFLFTNS